MLRNRFKRFKPLDSQTKDRICPAIRNAIVLIEPRAGHRALRESLVNVQNAKTAWGVDWDVVVMCHPSTPGLGDDVLMYRISDPGSIEGYNQLLTTLPMYDWLVEHNITGHILLTQTDAWLCTERGKLGGTRLRQYAMAYDYIGGACTWRLNRFHTGDKSKGVCLNGGFSLRSVMGSRRCILEQPRQHGNPVNEMEDVYFACTMKALGMRVAAAGGPCRPFEFAINTLAKSTDVLGIHKPWDLPFRDQCRMALKASPSCRDWLCLWEKLHDSN